MIQVYFFGPDLVAFIEEETQTSVVLTIDEAMTHVRLLSTGEGIATFRGGAFGEVERYIYSWSTPNVVQAIIGDHRQQIVNNYTINKNRNA
jgi:hypothetical protein